MQNKRGQSKRGRADRLISKTTGISRNNLRAVFAAGRVQINGNTETDPGFQVDEFSEILLDPGTAQQQILQNNKPVYLMLHKPGGVISATRDEQHQTALDLIDHPQKNELHIAGRLDLNSTGLLLLTNDSRWSESIMSPDEKVSKVYRVELENDVSQEYIPAFAEGMYFPFENITTRPAVLEILSPKLARVTLQEGRYHQIKRMFGRFRNAVINLHRERIGALELRDLNGQPLPVGHWREIRPDELMNQP